jgi:hypothetical protein
VLLDVRSEGDLGRAFELVARQRIRNSCETRSQRISTRFAVSSVLKVITPVILPAGRAKLATMAPGPPIVTMTTGMVPVAFWTAVVAGVPLARIRSTLRPTNSDAAANRSARPSADRYSMTKFCPSK